MSIRAATHAGSWYSDDPAELDRELTGFLARVPAQVRGIGADPGAPEPVPVAGARAIIAPHAGYAYSGPAAAWAYKCIDWTQAKRIFLLGPSHHFYLSDCALPPPSIERYATPLGSLRLDAATLASLRATGRFARLAPRDDEAEHSLELHLPYIRKMLATAFPNVPESSLPPLVPILVGNTSPRAEADYGRLLAPYLAAPGAVVVASSDFCHWGTRFRYTYYEPAAPAGGGPPPQATNLKAGARLRAGDRAIHESIAAVDARCMAAVEGGRHRAFLDVLQATGNTVCGRHPIGVIMAALEALEEGGEVAHGAKGRFRFVQYDRSSLVESVGESSVSYCSGYAVY